jgi:Nuclease-related domain/AAA domain
VPPSGLYPRGGPRPTTSHAEQALHRALATGLPQGWTAWHSLRVRTKTSWEGEGDFVIAIPDRGLLAIEVKGGAVEVRDGQWRQNGRAMDAPPREQGNSFARKLITKLEERGVRNPPRFALATAFPDTPFSNPPRQGDLDGAVIGQQDLPFLGEALAALRDRLFDETRRPADARWIDALHELWGETWTPRLQLGHRVRLREDDLVALDRDQVRVLDLIDENDRFLVMGGPGTGKTLLAREMWLRLRARGKRPVLLCWTAALAEALRQSDVSEVWTARELAAALLRDAGIELQDGAAPAAWTPETWDIAPLHAAADAMELARDRYDAVVVDEAQDFSPNDWDFVTALGHARPLYGFADEGQGFWSDRPLPKALFGALVHLRQRYRCPEPLARFADQYRSEKTETDDAPPARIDELSLVRVPAATALEDYTAKEIKKALGAGARPSDIAVLSLGGQTRTELCGRDRIGDVAVRRADSEDAADHVIADTFLRFKGLERPWVIVVELERGRHRYDVRMHVALTRATVGCVVVGTAEEIAGDRRIAALG